MSARLATMTDAEFAAEMAKLDAIASRIQRGNRRAARLTAKVRADSEAFAAVMWPQPKKDAA